MLIKQKLEKELNLKQKNFFGEPKTLDEFEEMILNEYTKKFLESQEISRLSKRKTLHGKEDIIAEKKELNDKRFKWNQIRIKEESEIFSLEEKVFEKEKKNWEKQNSNNIHLMINKVKLLKEYINWQKHYIRWIKRYITFLKFKIRVYNKNYKVNKDEQTMLVKQKLEKELIQKQKKFVEELKTLDKYTKKFPQSQKVSELPKKILLNEEGIIVEKKKNLIGSANNKRLKWNQIRVKEESKIFSVEEQVFEKEKRNWEEENQNNDHLSISNIEFLKEYINWQNHYIRWKKRYINFLKFKVRVHNKNYKVNKDEKIKNKKNINKNYFKLLEKEIKSDRYLLTRLDKKLKIR